VELPKDIRDEAERLIQEENKRQGILSGLIGRVSDMTRSGIAVVRDRDREGLSGRELELGARWSDRYERKPASNPYNREQLRFLQRQSPSWRKARREAAKVPELDEFGEWLPSNMEVPRG